MNMESLFYVGVGFGIAYIVCALVIMVMLFVGQVKELKKQDQAKFLGVLVVALTSVFLGATWLVMPFLGMIGELRKTTKEIK